MCRYSKKAYISQSAGCIQQEKIPEPAQAVHLRLQTGGLCYWESDWEGVQRCCVRGCSSEGENELHDAAQRRGRGAGSIADLLRAEKVPSSSQDDVELWGG